MAPVNAGFGDSIGIRKDLRLMVFDAYLEAAAQSSMDEALAALGPADWSRGGVVNDALNDAAVRSAARTPAMADIVRRQQDVKNEIAGLRRYLAGDIGGADTPLPQVAAQMRERINMLEQERTALLAELRSKFPDYDRLLHPGAPDAKDIAKQLSATQAMVLLLPGADAVYGWGVAADRPAMFVHASVNSADVAAMVKALRKQLDFGASADVGKRFDAATAYTLYEKLLAPLEPVLRGKTQLVVASGGALSQLPFALLQTAPGGGIDQSAPWLIKRTAVTQVPSLSGWLSIKTMAANKPAAQAFAGWGDPVFDSKTTALATTTTTTAVPPAAGTRSLVSRSSAPAMASTFDTPAGPLSIRYAQIPTLPDTRDELLSIAATLKSDPGKDVMLGAQATRDSVLQSSNDGTLAQKRVIAFATHGLMAGDLPLLSQPALALAATGREEQDPLAALLTLEDVLTLKLNADWVVLSACNSAAEDGRGDEAMSGLARGFFYAGSRSLLVTHWAVESESAKLLTTATFAHYAANPKAPKAESLRQAMLQVMAMPQFQHPAFWAPYALVGDGER
jgi:CHAT domain-containing protein